MKIDFNGNVTHAIGQLVRYVETAERRDYESRNPEDRVGHVFEAVKVVRDWLGGKA